MRPGERRQRGFTLLALLAVLALVMLGLAAAGPMLALDARREREQELLRVGAAYVRAIESYRNLLPGSIRSFPMTLDELLLDPRVPHTVRHLRALYPDPLDPARPWGVVRDDFNRIIGVYSQDGREPVRQRGLVSEGYATPVAQAYREWRFVVVGSGKP